MTFITNYYIINAFTNISYLIHFLRRNNHHEKKIIAVLTAVLLIAASIPAAFAADKSKTATAITSDGKTTVTISLPSAETKLSTDVVFVLDKSSSTAKSADAVTMLTALKDRASVTGASVKVGVVVFNKYANDASGGLQDITTKEGYDAAVAAFSKKYFSNSNMPAGIEAGKKMLDADTTTDASHKFLIVVSDGMTRSFSNKDGKCSYVNAHSGDRTDFGAGFGTSAWELNNPTDSNGHLIYPKTTAAWNAYTAQITAAVNNDGDSYDVPFGITSEEFSKYPYVVINHNNMTEAVKHATTVDKSLYYSYTYFKAAMTAGYHCYAVDVIGDAKEDCYGNYFMKYLSDIAGTSSSPDFSDITNDILYLIGSGTVTDTIGNSFRLDASSALPFHMTLNGQALACTALGNNRYGFGEAVKDKDYLYKYILTFDPDTNVITWQINVPVENAVPVQLSYGLVLKDLTKSGTFATNESAYLNAENSAGAVSITNDPFEIPYVTFKAATVVVTDPETPLSPFTPNSGSGAAGTSGNSASAMIGSPIVTVLDTQTPLAALKAPNTNDAAKPVLIAAAVIITAGAAVFFAIRRKKTLAD